MKCLLFLSLCFGLFSCDFNDPAKTGSQQKTAPPAAPSLSKFADTLKSVNPASPGAIDNSLQLFDVYAPNDSTAADSAASQLLLFVEEALTAQNKRFESDTTDYNALLFGDGTGLTDKQKALSSSLHKNKLKLVSDGEGGVYTVPAYETILPTIKERTSAAVDQYLDLVAMEDTAATFKDAGLVIETDELADRLVMSERILSEKLPARFAANAKRLNQFYTNALIRGSDNTPSVSGKPPMLTEEFEKGYSYLLAKYPASRAAAKINVWLTVVKSGNAKKVDDFLRLLPY